MTNTNLSTKTQITWCPGCPNFMILESVKQALANLIKQGYKHEDFTMTTDIGCNSKIFDYLNISGIYGLHGRSIPTALGIKLGNPNLHVLSFSGDGGAYAEGIAHFIHTCRYNSNMTIIVSDNRTFSLTTGQATPTSEIGYKTKAEPLGEFNTPLNPIKLALVSGATFIARCNAKDIPHTTQILELAIKHKGISFVEILQDCLVFNLEVNNLDKNMQKVYNHSSLQHAMEIADEWDYNNTNKPIPIGIFYNTKKPTLEEKWPQLKELMDKGIGWRDLNIPNSKNNKRWWKKYQ